MAIMKEGFHGLPQLLQTNARIFR